MDIGIISSRYAKALLKFATEKGENEEVYHSMAILGESFANVPTLRATLEDPVLTDEKKFSLLNTAAGETKSECLKEFFRLVLKNHRIAMIQFMAHSYINSYRKQQHLIHSRLTVPTQLSASTMSRLKGMVEEKTKNEVEFVVEVDPSIIGGFIMEYDTYCLDASIRGRLRVIRKQLLEDDRLLASKQG